MHQASATTQDRDADRISFTKTLSIVRRSVTAAAAFSLQRLRRAIAAAIGELTELRAMNRRRDRRCPRVVKHRRSPYPARQRASPASIRAPRLPVIYLCSLPAP
jgi:hypothetical protein